MTATDTQQGSKPRRPASGAQQKILAFASLIVLLMFFSVASPNFLQTGNILAILQATSVNGVLAVAATLVIITGGIDLSVGTLMTFTAVTAGVVLTYWGLPMPFGIIGAIAMGAFCGFISGTLVARLEDPALHRHAGHDADPQGPVAGDFGHQADLLQRHAQLSDAVDRVADRQAVSIAADPQWRGDPVCPGDGDLAGC